MKAVLGVQENIWETLKEEAASQSMLPEDPQLASRMYLRVSRDQLVVSKV